MTANPNPGDADSRRAISCLLVLEIADYEAKPVFDQIRLTQYLRQVLSDATSHIASDDVVWIVREQGAVLSFLADPEECFATALAIREAMLSQPAYRDLFLRIGINLGSVEIARDEFGHAYVSGAGRCDAERVMNQGPPREISVTRPFFEILSRVAPELAGALEYRGVFSDTLGPPLGVYRLAALHSGPAPNPAMTPGTSAQGSTGPSYVALPASQQTTAQPATVAASESRGVRRWQLRYALVALLIGAAALTSSSRFRVEVAAVMPTPQLAAAVTEAPMPGADAPDTGVSAAAPPATANVHQRPRAASGSSAEKPARTASTPARGGRDPARASDRAARIEPSREQEKRTDRSAAAPVSPADSATLLLAVRPWGEVYVDGTKMGVSPPLKKLQVAPGQRLITIKNSFLPEYSVRLRVDPEAQVTVAHDFSCTPNRERRCWEEISKGLAPQSRFRFTTVEAEPQTAVR